MAENSEAQPIYLWLPSLHKWTRAKLWIWHKKGSRWTRLTGRDDQCVFCGDIFATGPNPPPKITDGTTIIACSTVFWETAESGA